MYKKIATIDSFLDPRYGDEIAREKYDIYDKAGTSRIGQLLSGGAGTALSTVGGGLVGGVLAHTLSGGNPYITGTSALLGAFSPLLLASSLAHTKKPETVEQRVGKMRGNKLKKALIPWYAVYDDIMTHRTAKDSIVTRKRKRDEAHGKR